jgi:hypothetical protein
MLFTDRRIGNIAAFYRRIRGCRNYTQNFPEVFYGGRFERRLVLEKQTVEAN